MPPRNNLNLSGLPSRQDSLPIVSTPVVSNWRLQALARDWAMAQDPRFLALSPYMQDIILKDSYGPNFIFEPGTGMVDRLGNIVWDDSFDVNGFRIFAALNPKYEYVPKFLLNEVTTPTNGASIAELLGDAYEDPTEGYVLRQTTPNYSLNSGVSFNDLTPIELVRRLEQIYRLNPTPENAYRLNEARSFLTANPYDATTALLAVNSALAGAPFAAEYPALMSFVGDAAKAYALDRGIQAIHELNGGNNYYFTDAISPLANKIDDPFYRNLVLGASEYASPVWWYGPGLLNAAARSIGRRGIIGATNNLARQAVNQGTNLARGFHDTFNFGNITVPNAYMYATNLLNNVGNFVTNPRTLTTAGLLSLPAIGYANENTEGANDPEWYLLAWPYLTLAGGITAPWLISKSRKFFNPQTFKNNGTVQYRFNKYPSNYDEAFVQDFVKNPYSYIGNRPVEQYGLPEIPKVRIGSSRAADYTRAIELGNPLLLRAYNNWKSATAEAKPALEEEFNSLVSKYSNLSDITVNNYATELEASNGWRVLLTDLPDAARTNLALFNALHGPWDLYFRRAVLPIGLSSLGTGIYFGITNRSSKEEEEELPNEVKELNKVTEDSGETTVQSNNNIIW